MAVVLAFPASAAAKEFDFQGGGDPPVEMTMTGKSFDEPKRVTDFSISPGLFLDCPGYPDYPVPDPMTAPIQQQGIKLKRTKHGLEFKRWTYDAGFVYWDLQGRQSLKNRRRWFGLFYPLFQDPRPDCGTRLFRIPWEAKLTK